MQFSLGGNILQNYISQGSNQSTDSLRTINDIVKLESYLRQRKDSTFKSIDKLWRRIEQCETICMQLSDSVDVSYSRINQDNRSLNIERYEDLLPYTFKEVQWAKSSRVGLANQNTDKLKMVQKYQNCAFDFQNQLQLIETDQQRILGQLQSKIIQECKQYQQIMSLRQKEHRQAINKFEQRVNQVSQELNLTHKELQSELQGLYQSLSSQIANKLSQIEQQVASLSI